MNKGFIYVLYDTMFNLWEYYVALVRFNYLQRGKMLEINCDKQAKLGALNIVNLAENFVKGFNSFYLRYNRNGLRV